MGCQHTVFSFCSEFAHTLDYMDEKNTHPQMTRLRIAAEQNCGCESWADIARLLDTTDQVVNNWRRRGVPTAELLAIAEKLRVNPYWLRDGGDLPMVLIYPKDKDLVDLYKVAEKLPHEYRQLLTEQGSTLVKLTTNEPAPKKKGNGWQ